jgi:hypothetical protein
MMTDVRLPNTSRYPCWKPGKSEIDSLQYFRLQGVRHIYCMTFNTWLHKREIPDSDKIAMIIQASGANGIPENELRGYVELPKKLVDELLAALVDARMVRVAERDGVRWYFGW